MPLDPKIQRQWCRHHGVRGGTCPPPSPHFYEWLGTEGHHRRTFNYYNAVICQYNFTADGRTEIIFYLEIRTSVQEQAIARYSQ